MVERVLSGHPGVAPVAVVGAPDDEWGELVVAVVQPARPGAAPPPGSRSCARSLPDGSSRPPLRDWSCRVDALPMLASGKPDRTAVRSLVAAHLAR